MVGLRGWGGGNVKEEYFVKSENYVKLKIFIHKKFYWPTTMPTHDVASTAAFAPWPQNRAVATETVWPKDLKIFTPRPLIEKVHSLGASSIGRWVLRLSPGTDLRAAHRRFPTAPMAATHSAGAKALPLASMGAAAQGAPWECLTLLLHLLGPALTPLQILFPRAHSQESTRNLCLRICFLKARSRLGKHNESWGKILSFLLH